MWPTVDLVNKEVFMDLGKSETDWGSSQNCRCAKWSGMIRVKEEKYKKKNHGNEGEKRKEKEGEDEKKEEEENDRFFISGFEWSLSFEGDFLKF